MRKRSLWILLPLSGFLCACSPFRDDEFTAKIFPNGYWDFVVQLIAFVVLLILVFVIGYKPVKKMLKKRRDAVNAMIEDAKSNQAIAYKAAMEKDQTIDEVKQEAERIIESARKQAELERDRILKAADAEVEAKRRRAEEDIRAAEEASKEAVRTHIIDVAMMASENLLGREVNTEDNARLVADFVDGIDGEEGA